MTQTQNQSIRVKKSGLFISLLILTVFLILAEISFLIECSRAYLGDFKLIANHLAVPFNIIMPGVLYFILAQLLVHLFFLILVWAMARLAGLALHLSERQIGWMGIAFWFVSLLTVLLANRILFPNSKFSSILLNFLNVETAKIGLVVLGLFLAASVLLACFGLVLWVLRRVNNRAITLSLTLAFLTVIFIYMEVFSRSFAVINDAATPDRPNIIVIGVDSLRPDFLGFFGYAKKTPHIDHFLDHATVFSNALTPLARTYPSWVSILTGVYPKLNTIRTNLSDQTGLDLNESFPVILRDEGYQTIFATDETRFSNIDQRYGFDKVVTPPIGFNDFLLGTVNDFPISNLLVNTVIGQYLFPNSYGNRAVFATYDPDSFLHLLQPVLTQSRTKPTLLVVHFCLPHFPYAWAELPVKKVTLHHYQAALMRADKQFHDFMVMLQKNQFLRHSIVVLLSDHGEAVEIPGDRITDPDLFVTEKKDIQHTIPHFYPPSSDKEKVNMSGGHGTDVLGLPQYHTLLAFKTFGTKPNVVKVVSGIVSVMDIKPTLLEFLNIPLGRANGNPLEDYIFGAKSYVDKNEDFFTESDFSPEAVRSIHPEERKVLFEGIDYFSIEPHTARIVVRDSMLQMILSSKQYADYYGSWVLALYPQNSKVMMPILVDLKTGQWTNDLTSELAKASPAHHMLVAMQIFFGKDITTVENS